MAKSKSAKPAARYAGIPHSVMDHPDYIATSGNAIRLLLELSKQYNGYNNGDLHAAFSVMKKRGVAGSKTTLAKLLAELIGNGLIVRTREAWFGNPGSQCALYALTWQAIDDCKGKGLLTKPTRAPTRNFRAENIKAPCPVSEATSPST